MDDTKLEALLSKATKNELIYAVMAMSRFWCSSVSISELIYEKRLDDTHKKIEINLKKGSELNKRLQNLQAQKRNLVNLSEYWKLIFEINENNDEWTKLNAEYDKVEKLAFPNTR